MLFLAHLISYILNALLYFHLTDIEHCASSDFRCLYMDGCVPHSKVCDGIYDCLDTSDEMGCDISTKTPATTTAGDLPCSKHTVNHKLNNNSCNWIFVWDFISCSPLRYISTARIQSQIKLNIIVIVINLEILKHIYLLIYFLISKCKNLHMQKKLPYTVEG